jgi:hypothetical protein
MQYCFRIILSAIASVNFLPIVGANAARLRPVTNVNTWGIAESVLREIKNVSHQSGARAITME